jgi:hypothetical protein
MESSFIDISRVLPLFMKFKNDKGEQVEINFQNFQQNLPGNKPGLTHVKFKDGKEEWIRATEDEILEAAVEE